MQSLLRPVKAGTLGGPIAGAICGGLFGGIVVPLASYVPGDMITRTLDLQFSIFCLWALEGAALGSILGIVMEACVGLFIKVLQLAAYAQFIGALLSALVLGLFCISGEFPFSILFGLVSGAGAGYLGGRKYQDRLGH